jgi:HTH-type transcriptional dual regulator CecR, C-terminal domain
MFDIAKRLFFAMSRETILRRLGWKSLEGRNAEVVSGIIAENLDVLLEGLSSRESKHKHSIP